MLQYVMKTEEMNRALGQFSRLLDIRIAFFDFGHEELFLFDVKKRSPFCQRMRRDPLLRPCCEESDRTHLERARAHRQIEVYHCHRGLLEAVVPLFSTSGDYLGAFMIGQVRDGARKLPLRLPPAEKALLEKLPVSSRQRIRETGELLQLLSTTIVEKAWLKRCRDDWAQALEEFIHQHIREPLTVAMLAEAIHCSPSFLTHRFPDKFGQTPMEYIRAQKMLLARARLESGCKIWQVAQEFGFYDPYHFSHAFKKQFGHPPSRIRSRA